MRCGPFSNLLCSPILCARDHVHRNSFEDGYFSNLVAQRCNSSIIIVYCTSIMASDVPIRVRTGVMSGLVNQPDTLSDLHPDLRCRLKPCHDRRSGAGLHDGPD